jgi:cysteine desulfurase
VSLGDEERRLPHVLAVSFPGLVGEVLLHHLDQHGIYVSTGSACSQQHGSKKRKKSAADPEMATGLEAIGLSNDEVRGMLRISFGRFSTTADVDAICAALPAAVSELRALGL